MGFSLLFRFLHQGNVFDRKTAGPTEAFGYPLKCALPIEYHVGRVAAVMPVGERGVIGLETGHQSQETAWPQQAVEKLKLLSRTVEVLRRFGTGNEVITQLQGVFVREEKGVIDIDTVSLFLNYFGQGRAWAAAVIQTQLLLTQ